MAKEKRTIFDLSEEEYEDYENNPEKYEDVTDNSLDDGRELIFPNGEDD